MQNVKQELRRLIKETLLITYQKPVVERRRTVRQQLVKIQTYCKDQEKTFIFRELTIRCDQYGVGGNSQDMATLFRGPSEKASVAICVTQKGSILHRNDGCWRVWDNAGDVAPQVSAEDRTTGNAADTADTADREELSTVFSSASFPHQPVAA
ncbi:MAG: hypothetical protein AAF050_01325 [Cyanobacteria bacterium J06649_5]